MTPAEACFWAEVESPRANSRSLKLAYALLILTNTPDRDTAFWPKIHEALRGRGKIQTPAALDTWKQEVWRLAYAVEEKIREAA